MVISQENFIRPAATLTVTWEKLPDDYQLEEEPVENTGQPLIAGALREPLELRGYIIRNAHRFQLGHLRDGKRELSDQSTRLVLRP